MSWTPQFHPTVATFVAHPLEELPIFEDVVVDAATGGGGNKKRKRRKPKYHSDIDQFMPQPASVMAHTEPEEDDDEALLIVLAKVLH